MSLRFHWFLPTSGDGRAIVGRGHSLPLGSSGGASVTPAQTNGSRVTGAAMADRPPTLEYLGQIARSAEQLGFEAVLTPAGTWCEDAWLVTAALISQTERLRFLVAFRPGLVSPTLAAQMAATYQRISRGRLLLNVVTGGQAEEQARFGDHLSHDQRYARTGEFLAIVRGAWGRDPFDFSGEHYRVTGATVMRPPDPPPGIYFGGSSPAAGPVAARHADVYLTWGEPPAQVAETGLLKVFLDRLPHRALGQAVALPLMLMGVPDHAPGVDAYLRPLLIERAPPCRFPVSRSSRQTWAGSVTCWRRGQTRSPARSPGYRPGRPGRRSLRPSE